MSGQLERMIFLEVFRAQSLPISCPFEQIYFLRTPSRVTKIRTNQIPQTSTLFFFFFNDCERIQKQILSGLKFPPRTPSVTRNNIINTTNTTIKNSAKTSMYANSREFPPSPSQFGRFSALSILLSMSFSSSSSLRDCSQDLQLHRGPCNC